MVKGGHVTIITLPDRIMKAVYSVCSIVTNE